MNGPKFVNDFGKGVHSHIHDLPVNASDNIDIKQVVAKDAALVQDHTTDRAHFQGRFRATTFGDFKNRSDHAPELLEAQIEDHEREDAKALATEAAAELETAAAATGVIVEDHELHRFADDGGPVHD